MTETPGADTQPYKDPQQQAQPPWTPPPKNPKGSVSTKVWGVILLILGLVGFMMLIMNIASVTGALSSSTFGFGMDEEAKRAMDEFQQQIVEASMQRWSFWAYMPLELSIIVLSMLAGIFLIIKPSPRGRKFAISRALIVFLLLPISWVEQSAQYEDTAAMQDKMMTMQLEAQIEESFKADPPKDEAERKRRRERIMSTGDQMKEITKITYSVTLVLMVVFPLVFNALLLYFMLREGPKDYLENVAKEKGESIPGYDPSMGMIGPPPQAQHPGAVPSPGAQPPGSEAPHPSVDDPPKSD